MYACVAWDSLLLLFGCIPHAVLHSSFFLFAFFFSRGRPGGMEQAYAEQAFTINSCSITINRLIKVAAQHAVLDHLVIFVREENEKVAHQPVLVHEARVRTYR